MLVNAALVDVSQSIWTSYFNDQSIKKVKAREISHMARHRRIKDRHLYHRGIRSMNRNGDFYFSSCICFFFSLFLLIAAVPFICCYLDL